MKKKGLIVAGLHPIVFVIASTVIFIFLNAIFPSNAIILSIGAALGLFNIFVIYSFGGLPALSAYLLLLVLLAIASMMKSIGG